MATIGVHDRSRLTARGASVRSIARVEIPCTQGETIECEINALDWLETDTPGTITMAGQTITLTGAGAATVTLTAGTWPVVITAADGRTRRFDVVVSDDTGEQDYA